MRRGDHSTFVCRQFNVSAPNPWNKQQVRTRFERAAATYAEAAVVQREVGNRLLERFDVMRIAPQTILDIGCGPGTHTTALATRFPEASVIAVDQSPQMIAAAQKRVAGHENVEFLQGELESLPIKSASVDAAVCVLVLHHVPDPAAAVRELARILRPGGTALIVDMIEHDRTAYRHSMGHRWLGFGVPQMIRMLTDSGLSEPRFQALPSESEAKGPGLFACTAYKPT
jgi:ubiquinone/menaquinone biosynthesis C-methylase UbiE